MRRTTALSTSRPTATQWLRGMLSLLTLLVLLVGIPLGLVIFGGNPLPDHVPSWNEIVGFLSEPDTGEAFLPALAIVGWLCWAAFALSVLVELPAQIRRRPPIRLPALGWSQAAAGALLAAILTLFLSAGVARPAFAAPNPGGATPPADSVATQPLTTQPAPVHIEQPTVDTPEADQPPASPAAAESAPTAQKTVVVQRNDTLWGIAETYLGDGLRYPELIELNVGASQPDGRSLVTGGTIQPGWILTLPEDAVMPVPAAVAAPGVLHVVETGETLSGIALDELGDATLYPQIAEANAGTVQPDGQMLTDPNQIDVGWQLHIPSAQPVPDAAGVEPPPAEEPVSPTPPSPPAADPAPADVATAPLDESDTATAAPTSAPSTTAASNSVSSNSAASTVPGQQSRPGEATSQSDSDESHWMMVGGVGLLSAAGVLGLLGLKRMVQQRRRRPGHRIRLPDPPLSTIELQLRASEEPAMPILLDEALRSLAATIAADTSELPALISAQLRGTRLHLRVEDVDAAPIGPFAATGEPGVWQLDHAHPQLLSGAAAAATPAPYPTLVTLGVDQNGAEVLIDLEQAGAITLSGARDRIRATLATLAIELATAPWADHLIVHMVDFAPDLPPAIAGDRLRYSSSLDDVLATMESRAAQIDQILGDAGAPDVHTARTRAIAEDAWTPEILLTAQPLSSTQLDRISRIVQVAPPTSLAAVITAAHDQHTVPGPWRIDVDDTTAWVEPLGLGLRLHRLSDPKYRSLIAVLTAANDTESIPVEDWVDVPNEPTDLHELEPDLDELVAPSADSPFTVNPFAENPFTISLPPPSPGPATISILQPDTSSADAPSGDASPFQPSDEATMPAANGTSDSPTADDNDHESGDEERPVLDTTETPNVSTLDTTAPEIQILGPVRIAGVDDDRVDSNNRGRLSEYAAFMLLRPGRGHDEISLRLGGPDKPWTTSTRQTYTSRLRAWLGTDPNGDPYLPLIAGHGYRLAENVRSDWYRFQILARRGFGRRSPAGADDLEQALALVRGAPFADAGHRRYAWAEPDRQEMISRIVDVAHTLALWRLKQGNPIQARRAIAVGLDVEPSSELLYRGLFRAEHAAGNRQGIIDAADRLEALNTACGVDMEDETAALLRQLIRPQTRAAGS